MKKLTNDIELVKEAIKESAYLQMDDSFTKMRPNMKRCIVILREVPDSTTVEVVFFRYFMKYLCIDSLKCLYGTFRKWKSCLVEKVVQNMSVVSLLIITTGIYSLCQKNVLKRFVVECHLKRS